MIGALQSDITTEQFRELERRISILDDVIATSTLGEDIVAETVTIPALVNFADNTDFVFSDELYNVNTTTYLTYADDEDVLANWYGRTQATASSWTPNSSATESSESIRSPVFTTTGARTGFGWNNYEGSLLLTGGYRVGTKLHQKHANAGNYMIARMQLSKKGGSFTVDSATDVNTGTEVITKTAHGLSNGTVVEFTATTNTLPAPFVIDTPYYVVNKTLNDFQLSATEGGSAINITSTGTGIQTISSKPVIDPDILLKVSLWDNTDNRILRGSKPVLGSTFSGTAGSITRQYILEVQMSDGSKFYSYTGTGVLGGSFTTGQNQVINTTAVTSVNSQNFVTVSWDSNIIGASRFRVYRRTPAEADTNWYLIATVTNGSSSIKDYGGNGGGIWTVPTFTPENDEVQYARGYVSAIGSRLQTEDSVIEVSVPIQVPYNFSQNGDQYLQVEFVKDDYSNTTTAEVSASGIRIDRVGLSYTNGRWCPSARDLAILNAPPNTTPPPTGGGGGDIPPPNGCVEEHTPILIWNDGGKHYTLPANEIIEGDRLVAWNYVKKEFAPSKVKRVIRGISTKNYTLFTGRENLETSFSHEIIKDINNFKEGTKIRFLPQTILRYEDNQWEKVPILSYEILNTRRKVVSFIMEENKDNYISNNLASHNKPFNP